MKLRYGLKILSKQESHKASKSRYRCKICLCRVYRMENQTHDDTWAHYGDQATKEHWASFETIKSHRIPYEGVYKI